MHHATPEHTDQHQTIAPPVPQAHTAPTLEELPVLNAMQVNIPLYQATYCVQTVQLDISPLLQDPAHANNALRG